MAINFVSALDFDVISPEEVTAEEEFSFEIILETEEIYDVKAYVHEHNKDACEILSGEEWKSPYYYLKEAFPEKTEFSLLPHYAGETQICVKLRKSGGSSFDEVCNDITVLPAEEESSDDETTEEEPNIETKIKTNNTNLNQEENYRKITLNRKTEDQTFTTKTDKLRTATIYSFLVFCVLIIILLALRRL